MRAIVHGGAQRIDVPQPPNIFSQFKPLERDALFLQHLGHGQPHGPSPDQRIGAVCNCVRICHAHVSLDPHPDLWMLDLTYVKNNASTRYRDT